MFWLFVVGIVVLVGAGVYYYLREDRVPDKKNIMKPMHDTAKCSCSICKPPPTEEP